MRGGAVILIGYRRERTGDTYGRAIAWVIARELAEDIIDSAGRARYREFIAERRAALLDILSNDPQSLPEYRVGETIPLTDMPLPLCNKCYRRAAAPPLGLTMCESCVFAANDSDKKLKLAIATQA